MTMYLCEHRRIMYICMCMYFMYVCMYVCMWYVCMYLRSWELYMRYNSFSWSLSREIVCYIYIFNKSRLFWFFVVNAPSLEIRMLGAYKSLQSLSWRYFYLSIYEFTYHIYLYIILSIYLYIIINLKTYTQ
jgi:hypothetical protein